MDDSAGSPPRARPRREPIRRRRIHEDVAAGIRELIAEAGLRPEDRLPSERELMAEFGVGRSAVREAMLTLQRAGVVAVSSGERARVAEPSAVAMLRELSGAARHLAGQPRGAAQLRDALVLLEAGLARYAAERATEGDLAMLAQLLDASRRAVDDPVAFARADMAFRYGVAAIARNELLAAVVEGVAGWSAEPGRAAGARAAAFDGHRRIAEAIAARDPEAAGRAMRGHLEAGWALGEATDPLEAGGGRG